MGHLATSAARVAQAMGLVTRSVDPPAHADPATWAADVAPPSRPDASGSVTFDQATTLDSVFRSLVVLQTAVFQLSVDVWRGPDRIETPALVERPHPDTHLADLLAHTVTALAGHGNAYWRTYRGPTGRVEVLTSLDPTEVTPALDKTGQVVYHHRGRVLSRRDVHHLRYLRVSSRPEVLGLGPIQAARQSLGGQLTQRRYSASWFDESSVPDGILTSDQDLTAEEAEDYKQRWRDLNGPSRGPAVLGRGLDYRPIHLKPADVQWLETQNMGTVQVARLFGIPARLMLVGVEGSSLTYSNMEQEELAFARYTLMTYLREIELAFTAVLPRGQVARFNADALLRTDTKTRYEAHKIALDSGFLTIPEVRQIEGLAVLPEHAADDTQETPA